MRRLVPVLLGVVGLLLLVPGALFLTNTDLNSEDAEVALAPLVSIPLGKVGSLRPTKVLIPSTPRWRRIRREWGDPEFIIAAIASGRQFVYCLPDLGLTIRATEKGNPVPLEISDTPYGFSADCVNDTLKFRAAAGTELSVFILRAGERTLPSGELIIMGTWPYTKDKLVGIGLDEELRPVVKATSMLGLVLIGTAVYVLLCFRSIRKSAPQPAASENPRENP